MSCLPSTGVRDLKGYNARVETVLKDLPEDAQERPEKLPQIVIIVDELADLMMVASGEVEDAICRLAQLARAAGIHLVIATQRPSVDVITGLIKANMPSRIAFSVSSGVDSRTILDTNGAEKLLGNGDMLFAPQTYKKPARIQGAFVSDREVSDVVEFLKEKNTDEQYSTRMEEQIAQVQKSAVSAAGGGNDVDELFAEAGKFIIEKDKASIGMLQRWFKIGFNRADTDHGSALRSRGRGAGRGDQAAERCSCPSEAVRELSGAELVHSCKQLICSLRYSGHS